MPGLFTAPTRLKPTEIGDLPQAPDAYHNNLWHRQATMYQRMWYYFNRDVFDEALGQKKEIKKYPLGINLFETACANHQACLFGEFSDDVLTFRVKSQNQDAILVEDKLDQIWIESGRNAILLEGGLIAQILGGVVYRIVWNPVLEKVFIRLLQPDAWFPVWSPEDYHELLECYVGFQLDVRSAKMTYNVDLEDEGEPIVLLWEHWTRDSYEVRVGDRAAYWDRDHKFPMAGVNPFIDPQTERGIIPFQYFPRSRAGSFYGIPLGKNALAIQDEYNRRAGDMGDAVMEATHLYSWLTNRPKGMKGLERPSRTRLNDLGMGAPGRDAPAVTTTEGGKIPSGSTDWLNSVRGEARTSMYSPPVAYGQDEGSQRSALTLAFRMWPMTQAVRTCRGYWTDSFYYLHRKVILVATVKGGGYGLLPRHAQYRTIPVWAPMLPRDRAQLVNEIVVRKANGLISRQNAIEKLEERETAFIEEELARIDKELEEEAKRLAAQQQGPFGKGSSSATPAAMKED